MSCRHPVAAAFAFAALSAFALSDAAALSVPVSENAFVFRGAATTDQSEAQTLSVKSFGSDSNTRFAYLRFDTTSLPQGELTAASLDLRLNSAGGSLTLQVFGLLDSVSGETTWNSGLTWNTQPGAITTLPSAGDTTASLGSLAYGTAQNGTVLNIPLDLTGLAALLAADTNNQITLIVGNSSNSPVSTFASLDNTSGFLVPTLNVSITPAVPEPASGLLLLAGGAALMRNRRSRTV